MAGLVLANVAAVIGGGLILVATGNATDGVAIDDLPLTVVALLQIPLWLGYLGVPVYAGSRLGQGVVADFGLRQVGRDVPVGLAVGVGTQLVLVPLIYVPIFWVIGDRDVSADARVLTDKAATAPGVVLLIVVVVVGAPIIEELFFRGLLQRSVTNRFGPGVGLVAASVVFGLVHLQLLQLPALVMFGLVAGLLAQRAGRLGPAIWAHVGFNGLAVASLLLE